MIIEDKKETFFLMSQTTLEEAIKKVLGEFLAKKEEKGNVYISKDEVMKRLHVDASTLWRWNKSGYLKCTKVGNKVRYRLTDVETLQKGEYHAEKSL
jgi:hypothetical protein